MAAVLAALLIGILCGALLRPLLDAYICWRTARYYASLAMTEELLLDESMSVEPLR